MSITLQVTGFMSIKDSKKLTENQKLALIGRVIDLNINGVPVKGTLFLSKSGGLTARFAVKCLSNIGRKAEPKAERSNGFNELTIAVNSLLSSDELDEELGLNA